MALVFDPNWAPRIERAECQKKTVFEHLDRRLFRFAERPESRAFVVRKCL